MVFVFIEGRKTTIIDSAGKDITAIALTHVGIMFEDSGVIDSTFTAKVVIDGQVLVEGSNNPSYMRNIILVFGLLKE